MPLPLTGLDRWREWIGALAAFRASQAVFPGLYGLALPGFLPYPAYLALAIVAVGFALRSRPFSGLRRFGVAGVVASPSLYPHGFTLALPALLDLETFWFWVTLALTSTVLGGGWWAAIALVAASWFVPGMRRGTSGDAHTSDTNGDALHPMRQGLEPLGPTGAPVLA